MLGHARSCRWTLSVRQANSLPRAPRKTVSFEDQIIMSKDKYNSINDCFFSLLPFKYFLQQARSFEN